MSISVPDVHRRSIIVDGHCDAPYRMLRHNVHLDEHDTEAQVDLQSLLASGITASFFAAYVPPFYANRGAAVFCSRAMDLIVDETNRHPDVLASHRAALPIAAVLSGGFAAEALSKAEWLFDGVEQLVGEIDSIDEYFSA